ncbi:MAG: ArsR family transcriptional regulator [Candidatus Korarchaeota archaeon]|nr:ArsR family transcriptional regulator [Thermoproteota archaeon]MCR8455390.1 ArsR family transcriptional regulator [Thermoproteota archaeon]MCR8463076.1 ArsR family transcriptional regulator [Thermoproteota archaeon]MCR8471405.1 ArsR family transcriptional regulator [Thermoproteota archaeon]MCR8472048.1 ArsR family transcriptional regulator [Thermoproteota archaeon]
MSNNSTSLVKELLQEIERLKQEIAELKREREKRIMRYPEMKMNIELLAEFFGVLSSPERIMILELLWERDRYFTELESILELGPSSLKHHLSKLQRFNLVLQERSRGKYVISDKGKEVYSLIVDVHKKFLQGEKE